MLKNKGSRIHNRKMARWRNISHIMANLNEPTNSNVKKMFRKAFLVTEMQVKVSVKYHFIPIEYKISDNIYC